MKEKKHSNSTEHLYKIFIYVVLILLAVIIIVPVAWVFMASIKQNKEFYGNPWTLPEGFYFQNFIDAWNTAKMGDYMLLLSMRIQSSSLFTTSARMTPRSLQLQTI